MDKLELKHLAPYLPYGLKMSEYEYDLVLNTNNHPNHCYDLEYSIKEQIKPILRPLSDLDKYIPKLIEMNLQEDDKFTLMSIQESFNFKDGLIDSEQLDAEIGGLNNWVVNQLNEWHFDVFGLIPKGLAIDINTLKY